MTTPRGRWCASHGKQHFCLAQTTRLLEAVDSVDVSGHRDDVGGRADELHGRGAVEHELLAVRADHRRQVAVPPDQQQATRVRKRPGALSDTVSLALGEGVEHSTRPPLATDSAVHSQVMLGVFDGGGPVTARTTGAAGRIVSSRYDALVPTGLGLPASSNSTTSRRC